MSIHKKVCISKKILTLSLLSVILIAFLFILSYRVNTTKQIVGSKAAPPKQTTKPVTSSLIIGGEVAEDDEFPYFALLLNKDNYYEAQCGGVLIGESWVLTAAHCVYEFNTQTNKNLGVIVGINNLDKELKALHYSSVDKVYIFDSKGIKKIGMSILGKYALDYQDVALLRLIEPAKSVPTVSFLGNFESYKIKKLVGTKATAIGFGATQFTTTDKLDEKQPSSHLKKVIVTVESYNSSSTSFKYVLETSKSLERIDSGDSGGPLLVNLNNTPYCIGLASEGDGGVPDGKTRFNSVHDYARWIKEITGIKPNSGTAVQFEPLTPLNLPLKPLTICTDTPSIEDCNKKAFICSWDTFTNICINNIKSRW